MTRGSSTLLPSPPPCYKASSYPPEIEFFNLLLFSYLLKTHQTKQTNKEQCNQSFQEKGTKSHRVSPWRTPPEQHSLEDQQSGTDRNETNRGEQSPRSGLADQDRGRSAANPRTFSASFLWFSSSSLSPHCDWGQLRSLRQSSVMESCNPLLFFSYLLLSVSCRSQRVQLRSGLAGDPLRLPSYRLPTRVRIPHLMRHNESSILHERFRFIVRTEVTMDRLSVTVPASVSIPSSYAVQLIFPFLYERFSFIALIERKVCYRCSRA